MRYKTRVKNLVKDISAPLFRLNMKLLKNSRYRDIYMRKILEVYGETTTDYVSVMRRPKKAEGITSIEGATDIQNMTAIVMQGPLMTRDDFTLETVKIYRKIFPGCLIIVSTWNDSPLEAVKKIEQIKNCKVIVSEYPKHSGHAHLNYQVFSVMAGLRYARDSGRTYAVRTRTDQRIARIGCIEFMYQLLKTYPVDASVRYQKERIILHGGVGGSMFNAFWPGDVFAFGTTEDMIKYWDCELENVDVGRDENAEIFYNTLRSGRLEELAGMVPEITLQDNYYKRMGDPINEFTLKSYWERMKRQFIFLSSEDISLYFPKYLSRFDEATYLGLYYSDDSPDKCLAYNWNFIRWLDLYHGYISYRDEYENIYRNR